MIIDCVACNARVDGVEKGSVEIYDDRVGVPTKHVLVTCPVCEHVLLGITELFQIGHDEYKWEPAVRVWPSPEVDVSWEIPEIARLSLVEAKVCFKARAYSATAVMCGRTLEGLCKHHDPKTKTLHAGLKKMKESGHIDSKIFEWSEALRKHRNLGAHATTDKVSRDDAQDLLDFCTAICEYVFVLNEKFRQFQVRQK